MENKDFTSKTEEKNVRITIDVPESKYIRMKTELIHKRMTIRRYFLDFLERELFKESEEII